MTSHRPIRAPDAGSLFFVTAAARSLPLSAQVTRSSRCESSENKTEGWSPRPPLPCQRTVVWEDCFLAANQAEKALHEVGGKRQLEAAIPKFCTHTDPVEDMRAKKFATQACAYPEAQFRSSASYGGRRSGRERCHARYSPHLAFFFLTREVLAFCHFSLKNWCCTTEKKGRLSCPLLAVGIDSVTVERGEKSSRSFRVRFSALSPSCWFRGSLATELDKR